MENEHVITGLERKRAEIAADLRDIEKRAAQLRAQIGAIDTVLALYDPSLHPRHLRPRGNRAKRLPSGEFSRGVLAVLRQATEPVTARQIAEKLAEDQGLNLSGWQDWDVLTNRVRSVLSRRRLGVLHEKVDGKVRWRVAGSE